MTYLSRTFFPPKKQKWQFTIWEGDDVSLSMKRGELPSLVSEKLCWQQNQNFVHTEILK